MGGAAQPGSDDSIRRRILRATLDVIAVDGLDAVRHRRVAELAGVSLGSTTYHFTSRDDLIEAAFELFLGQANEFLDELERTQPDGVDAAATVADYVVRLLTAEFAEELVGAGAVHAEYELMLYAARAPRVAERLVAWEAAQRALLEVRLRDAGAQDPALAARTLLALVRGLEIERLTSGRPLRDLRRRVDVVVRALTA